MTYLYSHKEIANFKKQSRERYIKFIGFIESFDKWLKKNKIHYNKEKSPKTKSIYYYIKLTISKNKKNKYFRIRFSDHDLSNLSHKKWELDYSYNIHKKEFQKSLNKLKKEIIKGIKKNA